ncbi:MAG: L,D-transpeptidase, partial [Firmicutes bacterium]|nr:L,D-transpeptidase [Bacillota bacterium]
MSAITSKSMNKDHLSTGRKLLAVLIVIVMAVTLLLCIGSKPEEAKASTGKYWLKVNRLANVVTAYKYKNGKYVPYRAMLCSSGGENTPLGTFHTLNKYRWKVLMGPVYGQYNTRIYKHYLFHSVWYFN